MSHNNRIEIDYTQATEKQKKLFSILGAGQYNIPSKSVDGYVYHIKYKLEKENLFIARNIILVDCKLYMTIPNSEEETGDQVLINDLDSALAYVLPIVQKKIKDKFSEYNIRIQINGVYDIKGLQNNLNENENPVKDHLIKKANKIFELYKNGTVDLEITKPDYLYSGHKLKFRYELIKLDITLINEHYFDKIEKKHKAKIPYPSIRANVILKFVDSHLNDENQFDTERILNANSALARIFKPYNIKLRIVEAKYI